MSDAVLNAALGYAANGFSVVPLHAPIFEPSDLELEDDDGQHITVHVDVQCTCQDPQCMAVRHSQGKHPTIKSWTHEATSDEAQIRLWFTDRERNVGIATGSSSNLVVIDVDDPQAWRAVELMAGDRIAELDTARVASGRDAGGFHLYFLLPSGANVRSRTFRGIDILSNGKQVVAPPSIHRTGRQYAYMAGYDKYLYLPDWLLSEMDNDQSVVFEKAVRNVDAAGRATNIDPLELALDRLEGVMVLEGARDDHLWDLCRVIARMHVRWGWTTQQCQDRVLRFAKDQCDPPLSKSAALEKLSYAMGRVVPLQPIPEPTDEEMQIMRTLIERPEPVVADVPQQEFVLPFFDGDFWDVQLDSSEAEARRVAVNWSGLATSFSMRSDDYDWWVFETDTGKWRQDSHVLVGWAHNQMHRAIRRQRVDYYRQLQTNVIDQERYDEIDAALSRAETRAQNGGARGHAIMKRAGQFFRIQGSPSDVFDYAPHLLHTASGVFDLTADPGTPSRAPLPQDYFSRRTPVLALPGSTPLFDDMIARALPDASVRQMIVDWLALSLFGIDPKNQHAYKPSKFVLLVGEGATGKTAITDLMLNILGMGVDGYSNAYSKQLFVTSQNSKADTFQNVDMRGPRFGTNDYEIGADDVLNEGALKSIVDFNVVTERRIYMAPVKVIPTVSFMLSTNQVPKLKDNDSGTHRRFLVVRFDNVIPEEMRRDKYGAHVAREEGRHVLYKLIQRARELHVNKTPFTVPKLVNTWSGETFDENNPTAAFVDMWIEVTLNENDCVLFSEAHEAYKAFPGAIEMGDRKFGVRFGSAIAQRLQAAGAEVKKAGAQSIVGVRLKRPFWHGEDR